MSIGIHKNLRDFDLFWTRPMRGGMDWNAVNDFVFPDRSGRPVSLRSVGGGWADNGHSLAVTRSQDIHRWLAAR